MSYQLEKLYRQTSDHTLSGWQQEQDGGAPLSESRYAKDKFALTAGIRPDINDEIHPLLAELHRLSQRDPLADPMPFSALHFTFLAITQPIYIELAAQVDFTELQHAFNAITPLQVSLTQLRLVALPGQLLLAGIPDANSIAMRAAFTQRLLSTPWRTELQKRYPNTALPPPFWHSTLLRYEAEQLPQRFRSFFLDNRKTLCGAIEAPLKLVMSNYNWSRVRIVAV